MILYQTLMAFALPFFLAHQAVFGAKGALGQRLGLVPVPKQGLTLWIHAASVGEVTSARWVIDAVLAAQPGLQILVTTNTATARERVRQWNLHGVTATLAPFDSAGAAGRLLDDWRPQALVIVENELWPARIKAAENRGVPVLVIGARISERSARRWAWGRGMVRQMLSRLTWVSAQDADSLTRLGALGLPAQAQGPVVALKALGKAQDLPAPFPSPAARGKTLLAASTHEGEEALVLDAFLAAKTFDLLILAPRHPQRWDEVASLLRVRGIGFAQRSKSEVPDPDHSVYLADSMGEMDLWYAMAGVTVIGGSFAAKGGHTPWEPARYGSAIVHGPMVQNFAQPFAALDRAGGALQVADGAGLAATLALLDANAQARMATTAERSLTPANDGAEVVAAIVKALRG